MSSQLHLIFIGNRQLCHIFSIVLFSCFAVTHLPIHRILVFLLSIGEILVKYNFIELSSMIVTIFVIIVGRLRFDVRFRL